VQVNLWGGGGGIEGKKYKEGKSGKQISGEPTAEKIKRKFAGRNYGGKQAKGIVFPTL